MFTRVRRTDVFLDHWPPRKDRWIVYAKMATSARHDDMSTNADRPPEPSVLDKVQETEMWGDTPTRPLSAAMPVPAPRLCMIHALRNAEN